MTVGRAALAVAVGAGAVALLAAALLLKWANPFWVQVQSEGSPGGAFQAVVSQRYSFPPTEWLFLAGRCRIEVRGTDGHGGGDK